MAMIDSDRLSPVELAASTCPAGHHQNQAIAPVQHCLQPQGGHAFGEDADVGAAVDDGQHGLATVGLFQFDTDASKCSDKASWVGPEELRHC